MRALLAVLLATSVACAPAPTPSPTASRTLAADAPLYFSAVSGPARRGGEAFAIVRTAPGIRCSGVFLWPGMPSGGQQLAPLTTGTDGAATFRWTVDAATPPGSWRIDVTCLDRVVSTHVPID